jgi:1,4-alpha-glucan branching enzyme
VHGKRALLDKMPGDEWQRFANLRLLFTFMHVHPGKKLHFMGGEFGQWNEWNHDRSLDWSLLDFDTHRGVQKLVADLNRMHGAEPALHEVDFDAAGFEWIDCNDNESSVLSLLRRAQDPDDFVVCVLNFTPVARQGYRVGVPVGGAYAERLNSDASVYGGSNIGNAGRVDAEAVPCHGRPWSLNLTLPPLGGLILKAMRG